MQPTMRNNWLELCSMNIESFMITLKNECLYVNVAWFDKFTIWSPSLATVTFFYFYFFNF